MKPEICLFQHNGNGPLSTNDLVYILLGYDLLCQP